MRIDSHVGVKTAVFTSVTKARYIVDLKTERTPTNISGEVTWPFK